MNTHIFALVLALLLAAAGMAERLFSRQPTSSRPATWGDLERLTWADLEAGLPVRSQRRRWALVVGVGIFVVEVLEALAGYFDQ